VAERNRCATPCARSGFERDAGAYDAGGIGRAEQAIDTHRPGKPVRLTCPTPASRMAVTSMTIPFARDVLTGM
jgi:hypothetical protein